MYPDVLNAILRQDLGAFTHKAFATIRPGDPFKWNWHIQSIAWHLQQVADGRIRRLIITVPPRNLKSICASVALPAWFLGRDPSRRVICASYAQELSTELHNLCRGVMQASWYRELYPRTRLSPAKNTESEFKTTQGGGRLATSVEGVLTGRGANLIIIDDPMKPLDAMSETARARVQRWYDGTVLSRLDDKAEGAIILVMQRLHVDDLAGHLLERGGWHHLNLPAMAETDEVIPIGPGQVHRRRIGDLLHPERDSADVLEEIRRTLGPYDYPAQYQQQPVPIDGGLIKGSWFRRYKHALIREPGDQIVQSLDTASKAGELNDYSVCTTWLIREGRYYLLDVERVRLDYPDLKRRVLELYHQHRPHAMLIEDKGSGTQLIQELSYTGAAFPIAINPQGDKVMRASNQSGQIEAGRVFLPEDAPWLIEFEREIAAFPNGRHDDQVDSMTQFLTWAMDDEFNVPRIRSL
jgi:predicted phage terminase large subunit-like protein